MPYPCCCRQVNNGQPCNVCGGATPAQLALTWPGWRYYYYSPFPTETLIRNVPTGTHILTQVPGSIQGGCCWAGPAFAICTDGSGRQLVDRLFVWRAVKTVSGTPTEFLNAGMLRQQLATTTTVSICGSLGASNTDSAVQWSKTTLAGCRSGPYTSTVAAFDGQVFPACQQSLATRFNQTAGAVTLNAV